jgi:thymidylate synthase (FAD)
MFQGSVKIMPSGDGGVRASAAACRISTSEGTALDAFAKGGDRAKDLKLIGKVLSSGHHTVAEHAYFTVAFNNVSVLTEQLMIEHRLAAYTVKSRRYVDFSGAGYVVPEGLGEEEQAYRAHMDYLFGVYTRLVQMGVPIEDARFVLPYCFRSNFIMSCDARELSCMTHEMAEGRLSAYPEMKYLGGMLSGQLEEVFPGATKAFVKRREDGTAPLSPIRVGEPAAAAQSVELVFAPSDPDALLRTAKAASGRGNVPLRSLVRGDRPRELEMLNYIFRVKGVSLACVTHFTRHRIQSLIVPAPYTALAENTYVLPASVKANPEALSLYTEAFAVNAAAARAYAARPELLGYFALAGCTVDILFGMNARELLHFLRLRTCARAQWEIRDAANEMLSLLMEEYPALFRYYGPSCAVLGYCPEGRLSCGKPRKTEE